VGRHAPSSPDGGPANDPVNGVVDGPVDAADPHPGRTRRRSRRALWAGVLVVALIGGSVAAAVAAGPRTLIDRVRAAAGTAPRCAPTAVRLDATPAITPAIRTVLADQQGRQLADGSCLRIDVNGVTPDQVVAGLRAVGTATSADVARLPDLWVPDASLWVARAPKDVPVAAQGSLAHSPVIIATSEATARRLGWTEQKSPTWAEAVTGVRPVAVDVTTDACGLATAFALHATIPDDTAFRRSLAALSLAVDAGTMVGSEPPLDLVGADSPATPLIPDSEQAAVASRRSGLTSLAMIYPRDGSPVLDFPLLRVAAGRRPASTEAAVAAVASALRTPAAETTFQQQGFRLPGRGIPQDDGVRQAPIRQLDAPGPAQVNRIVGLLTALAAPTRMLALIDVSSSMTAPAGSGSSRLELVRDAASATLARLPPNDSVGAWVFASNLNTDAETPVDWKQLADVARLDAPDGARSHREQILADLRTLPEQTRAGGTSIYDTVDAAVRHMQAGYDGSAANVVVVLTDGSNRDRDTLTLTEAVSRLKAGVGRGAVRVIAVAIGPDADLVSLTTLAEATPSGRAYRVNDPADLQNVLLDALVSRG
jgi:hypothetical protein